MPVNIQSAGNLPIVLVTGASGFLGSRIVERLVLERRARVRVLLRAIGRASSIATLPIDYRIGNVTDPAAVGEAVQGCDAVIHCASGIEAGVSPEATTTCLGTETVANACVAAKVKLVHISSCSVYGTPLVSVVDETAPHAPRSRGDTYAMAKIAAESKLRERARQHKLQAAILQPTLIFGPYSQEWTITPLTLLQQSDIAMEQDDTSVCNAVYVDDVASAAFLAMRACDTNCESYLINGRNFLNWTSYLSRHAGMGTSGKIVTVPPARAAELRAAATTRPALTSVVRRLIRENRDVRTSLLSTRLGGGAYSLVQKYGSKSINAVVRANLSGAPRPEAAAPKTHPAMPLQLPPGGFIAMSRQAHVYSNAKAERMLGYTPRYSVDDAVPIIKAWAEWSRLVASPQK